jgi:hypothetical protein
MSQVRFQQSPFILENNKISVNSMTANNFKARVELSLETSFVLNIPEAIEPVQHNVGMGLMGNFLTS